ncbi:cytochrome P450 [Bisporella sp. PMI_857]|nr:cytochrome P450 [Bisporella sp. PMI_857]
MAAIIAILVAIIVIYALHKYSLRDRIAPAGVPWVGVRNEWFSILRAHWRDQWDAKKNLEEGYRRFSKRGLPFMTPSLNLRPEVILPPSSLKWLIEQPDTVLSIETVLRDAVAFDYISPSSWDFARPFHVEALNKMPLDLLTSSIVDEIRLTIDELWGLDTQSWREVQTRTLGEVIARITNRVFVGGGLSRDRTYGYYTWCFVNSIVKYAFIIRVLIPPLLRPILAPIVASPVRYYDWRCSRYIVPVVKERLAAAAMGANSSMPTHEQPKEMLQFLAKYAVRSNESKDADPQSLASRLLSLNFVGIHTSTITMVNAILDIMALGTKENLLGIIRTEAASVLRAHGGVWSKAAANQLVKNDSTFRESLRISAFKGRGLGREVVAPSGVTLPDGTYLPKHTRVGAPTTEIHTDGDNYDDPVAFRPLRFEKRRDLGMVVANEQFIAFGLGKHACPGRFFSAHELKLLLAYIALNYDIEPLDVRPPNEWWSDFSLPQNVKLRVRRRKQ